MNSLKFGHGNAKLPGTTLTFSLPAGYTCPGALHCLAFANRESGKIVDGVMQQFRCFSASAESTYTAVREARWHNYDALRAAGTREAMANLIHASLPTGKFNAVRIHVSGDFFSAAYFLAWCDVARRSPSVRFYAYTKSIPLWKAHSASIPENLVLTASLGGKFDDQAENLKTARVVFSKEQAAALALKIDHDDKLASHGVNDFALLIHGPQRAGSDASKAKSALAKSGFKGYSNAKK
jgi:hypothetical protein